MVAADKVNGRMAKKKAQEKDSGKAKLAALIDGNEVLKTTLQQIEKQFGDGSIMPAAWRWMSHSVARGFPAAVSSRSLARSRVAKPRWLCM
jgi:hypothetical protein